MAQSETAYADEIEQPRPGLGIGRLSLAGVSPLVLSVAAGIVLAGIVVWRGWISDDAFITLTYSRNILDGHGPVFIRGEHVQAFTHPLWLGILTLAYAIWPDPLGIAVTLGAVLTLATFFVIGRGLADRASSPAVGVALAVMLALVFGSSEAWRSFQTSGLENSLSGFLIALVAVEVFRDEPRAGRLSLLASLLVLSRPDFVVLMAPVGLVLLLRRRPGDLPRLVLGLLPLAVWLVFSFVYYDALVPNTAAAKLGIFETWQGIEVGAAYAFDWLRHESLPVAGCVVLLVAGLARCRRPLVWALAAGGVLYVAYVVYIGGDFMRGRMLLAPFVVFSLVGVLALAEASWPRPRLVWAACAVSIALAVLFQLLRPPFDNKISAGGVVWEREFYWGFQVQNLDYNNGRISGGWVDGTSFRDMSTIDALHAYTAVCGPVTVHATSLGFIGYNAGPDLRVIDLYGLTDKAIARLPSELLLLHPPRAGHPLKAVPIGYLAGRGDVAILTDWWQGIEAMDCSLTARALAHANNTGFFYPPAPWLSPLR